MLHCIRQRLEMGRKYTAVTTHGKRHSIRTKFLLNSELMMMSISKGSISTTSLKVLLGLQMQVCLFIFRSDKTKMLYHEGNSYIPGLFFKQFVSSVRKEFCREIRLQSS